MATGKRLIGFLSLFAAVVLIIVVSANSSATGSQTWSDTSSDPIVSNGYTIDASTHTDMVDSHVSITGTLECVPADNLSDFEDVPSGACWYRTNNQYILYVERGGYHVISDLDNRAGLFDSTETQLFPTPSPDVFIQAVPDSDSGMFYLYFRRGDSLKLTAGVPDWGHDLSLNYTFAGPGSSELRNWDGTPLKVDDNFIFSQINYSDNGQWMSFWDNDGRVARVNLNSFQETFAYVESSSDAINDFAVTSVSPSGRYMAVSVAGKDLRVIDFDDCSLVDFDNGVSQFCSTRYLNGDLAKFIGSDMTRGVLVDFINDDLLSYDVGQPDGSYYSYYVRAPNTLKTTYIALGDSYASGEGEGNNNFYAGTDVHKVNMCHLAWNSYPFLIARDLHFDSAHSVACSGAEIVNMLGNSIFDNDSRSDNSTNQYSNKVPTNPLGQWLPGYYAQSKFVSDDKPQIVTISISGNDIKFADIIESCIGIGTCFDTYGERLELVDLIDRQFNRLVDLYSTIKRIDPGVRIYVIGYPSIVSPSSPDNACGSNVKLNLKERVFANELEGYLNSVIKLAAKRSGVVFVDTTNAFVGHRLCEPLTKAANGLTFGNDELHLISKGSYHPNYLGHNILERLIEESTNDLTEVMPRADPYIGEPIVDPSIGLLQDIKGTSAAVNKVYYAGMLGDVKVFPGADVSMSYHSSGLYESDQLVPNSPFSAVTHSTPVNLGTFYTDGNGDIDVSIKIPSDIPVGFHTIDFYAAGLDGQTHDIRQVVYVYPKNVSEPLVNTVSEGKTDGSGSSVSVSDETGRVAKQNNEVASSGMLSSLSHSTNENSKSVGKIGGNHKVVTSSSKGSLIILFVLCSTLTFLLIVRYARNKNEMLER